MATLSLLKPGLISNPSDETSKAVDTGIKLATMQDQITQQKQALEKQKLDIEAAKLNQALSTMKTFSTMDPKVQGMSAKYLGQKLADYGFANGPMLLETLKSDDASKFMVNNIASASPQELQAIGLDPQSGVQGIMAMTDPMAFRSSIQDINDRLVKYRAERRGVQDQATRDFRQAELDKQKLKAAAETKATEEGPKLTPAEKKIDEEFGKGYAAWVQGNQRAVDSDIQTLLEVEQQLENSNNLTGPIKGAGGEGYQTFFNPQGKAVADAVASVTQKNLKEILGGQFAQKEGEQIIKRAFDPQLSEKENLKRVRKLREMMQEAAKDKTAAANYFEENGTLKGFKVRKTAPASASAQNAQTFDRNGFVQAQLAKGRTQEEIDAFLKSKGL